MGVIFTESAPIPPAPDLATWAGYSVDMVPHVDQLREYARDAKKILEFGVRSGVSTLALLEGLPPDGTMVSVDVDISMIHYMHFRMLADPRLTLIFGHDRDVKVMAFYPELPDILMIDADHTYDSTLAELRIGAYLGARRIILHDYLYGSSEPACKVKEAVDEFVATGDYEWEALHQSKWGLAVLRRV
ncbi:MAG TPA: class I SAM-dependent methyltransferase [Candidatus Deferrimicrobiaceae bacterium]